MTSLRNSIINFWSSHYPSSQLQLNKCFTSWKIYLFCVKHSPPVVLNASCEKFLSCSFMENHSKIETKWQQKICQNVHVNFSNYLCRLICFFTVGPLGQDVANNCCLTNKWLPEIVYIKTFDDLFCGLSRVTGESISRKTNKKHLCCFVKEAEISEIDILYVSLKKEKTKTTWWIDTAAIRTCFLSSGWTCLLRLWHLSPNHPPGRGLHKFAWLLDLAKIQIIFSLTGSDATGLTALCWCL